MSRSAGSGLPWTALLALVALLAACATTMDGAPRPVQLTEEVWYEAPAGWLDLGSIGDGRLYTRDGVSVGHMALGFQLWTDLASSHDGPALDLELAWSFWAQLRRDYSPDVLSLEELSPALVAGQPGFVLRATWRGGDGLRQRLWLYGVRVERHLVWLRFQAPALHQFERQLPAFQALLRSVRVR